jgi:hypothetical protein
MYHPIKLPLHSAQVAMQKTQPQLLYRRTEQGKNPWGSGELGLKPNKVYGFYAVNEWLASSFK